MIKPRSHDLVLAGVSSFSMAAMLSAIIIIGCMCTQSMLLTMLTMTRVEWCSNSMHACGSVSIVMGVCLAVAAGALLFSQKWKEGISPWFKVTVYL